jgi:hypothetical protein
MHHHLNLRDAVEIADFMASHVEYLPINERKPFEKILSDLVALVSVMSVSFFGSVTSATSPIL